MAQVVEAFTLPSNSNAERARETRKSQELVRRSATTLGMASLWGLAAGSANPLLALANVYKVPMVIALSLAVAMPAVFVTRRLLRLQIAPLALVAAVIASLERGALVLLGFAPLLAVYAYTSQWVAPVLAQVSGVLALLCGAVALRSELGELTAPRGALTALGLVTAVALGLSLLQLISLATPVLPIHTSFGAGIDGLFHR